MGANRVRACFPEFAQTVGGMLDAGRPARAICDRCKGCREVDLAALIAAKGRDFSLVNKRARCRFTKGCEGWTNFYYLNGVYRPLWDDATALRWVSGD